MQILPILVGNKVYFSAKYKCGIEIYLAILLFIKPSVVYAMEFGWTLYTWTLYMEFACKRFIYFGGGYFFLWIKISMQATLYQGHFISEME